MSDVENHQAGQSGAGASKGRSSSAEIAKNALDQASSKAKSSLKGATDTYSRAYGSAARRVSDASRRSTEGLNQSRDSVQRFIEENPIMVGVVGLAAGLLVGSLLPGTRRENQAFGRYADEVRDQGLRYARGLAEQGKHFVEETLDSAAQGDLGAGGSGGSQGGAPAGSQGGNAQGGGNVQSGPQGGSQTAGRGKDFTGAGGAEG